MRDSILQSVIAVVLTYNRRVLLLEVLEALKNQDCGMPDVLVIDNHSTDGTKEAIKDWLLLDNIFYEDTGENLGGAGGFNYAIKRAILMGYDRLWIMDDDCLPERRALIELMHADRELNGKFGWLSSLAYWTDGNLCKLNEHDYKLGKRIRDYSEPLTPAITASFVSLYVPATVILKVGLNIKDFYMWADDWELTRRISRLYPCYVVKNSEVVHKTTHNFGNNIATDDVERIWRYKYAYRNEVYVLKQDGIIGIVHWICKLCYHSLRIVFQSQGNKVKKLKLMFSSACNGLAFHPEIEYIEKGHEFETK